MTQSVAARIILLLSQIALGWILFPQDFGLGALAGTITALAWSLIGFGIDDMLLQRGRAMMKWQRTVFVLGIGIGTVVALIVICIAPLVAALYGRSELKLLLWLTAASLFVAGFEVIPMVKIRASFDFKWLAGLNLAGVLLAQGLTIIFALCGFGAYSFFLPLPIQILFRVILLWMRTRPRLDGQFSWRRSKIALSSGSKILGARVSEAVTNEADYFVLGLFASVSVVGFYTFAFRLAAAPVKMMSQSFRGVLVPLLVEVRRDATRRAKAGVEVAELLAFTVTPFCFMQAVVAEPALLFVFGEKWAPSAAILQILSLGLPALVIGDVARSDLIAAGQFSRAMRVSLISLFAFIIACICGTFWGLGIGLAVAVSVHALLTNAWIFWIVYCTPENWLKVLDAVFLRPFFLSSIAAGAAWGLDVFVFGDLALFIRAALLAGFMLSVYCALMFFFGRRISDQLVSLIRLWLARRKTASPGKSDSPGGDTQDMP